MTQELAWAAGLFEGEGTIRINKATKRNLGALVVSVVSTDAQITDFFQARWPGHMKQGTGLTERQRPAWVWVIAARQAAAFIREVLPYFRRDVVRERSWLGLEFQDQKLAGRANRSDEYREQQWSYYLQMRELNLRGAEAIEAESWRKRA